MDLSALNPVTIPVKKVTWERDHELGAWQFPAACDRRILGCAESPGNLPDVVQPRIPNRNVTATRRACPRETFKVLESTGNLAVGPGLETE